MIDLTSPYEITKQERTAITIKDIAATEEAYNAHYDLESFMEQDDRETSVLSGLENDVSLLKGLGSVNISTAIYALEDANLTFNNFGDSVAKLQKTKNLSVDDPDKMLVTAIEEKMNFLKGLYLKAATFVQQLINKAKGYFGKIVVYFSTKSKSLNNLISELEESNIESYEVSPKVLTNAYNNNKIISLVEGVDPVKAMDILWENVRELNIEALTEDKYEKNDIITSDIMKKYISKNLPTLVKTGMFGDNFTAKAGVILVSFSNNTLRCILKERMDDKLYVKGVNINIDDKKIQVSGDPIDVNKVDILKLLEKLQNDSKIFTKNFDKAQKEANVILKEIRNLVDNARKDDGLTDKIKERIAVNKILARSGYSVCMDMFKLHKSFTTGIMSFVDVVSFSEKLKPLYDILNGVKISDAVFKETEKKAGVTIPKGVTLDEFKEAKTLKILDDIDDDAIYNEVLGLILHHSSMSKSVKYIGSLVDLIGVKGILGSRDQYTLNDEEKQIFDVLKDLRQTNPMSDFDPKKDLDLEKKDSLKRFKDRKEKLLKERKKRYGK